MKRYIRDHGLAPRLLAVMLLGIALFTARYGVALNPWDGFVFPEVRVDLSEKCRPADWFWRS